jgi:hypothetical protein
MTRRKESRSFRLYALLLELYPPAFLQRHRAEMLQNFADLEDAATSKAALWLLIGRDLAMSLVSHFFASRLGHYVISVLIAWILIFTVGYFRYGSTPGHPLVHVFGGFLLGMLSMYIATRLYGTRRNSSRAIYVIGVLGGMTGVAWMLFFTVGNFPHRSPVGNSALQVIGGVLLGMLAMYIATRLYQAPQNSSYA